MLYFTYSGLYERLILKHCMQINPLLSVLPRGRFQGPVPFIVTHDTWAGIR